MPETDTHDATVIEREGFPGFLALYSEPEGYAPFRLAVEKA